MRLRPALVSRQLLLLVSSSALLLGGLAVAPAAAAPTGAVVVPVAQRQPRCDSETSYKIDKNQGWSWYAYDGGTIDNRSRKASTTVTFTHSENHSKSTTKSAEVGLSVKAWVVEINGKYGYSVSKTVSYTTSSSFSVTVPGKTKVKYRSGIILRQFRVKITHTATNCKVTTSHGHVYAADNLTQVSDA